LSGQSERLDRLLYTAQEIESRDPLGNLYDLAWSAFADLESGNPGKAASSILDPPKYPSVATEAFLYDYRNAVGAMTALYVAQRTRSASFSATTARRILSLIKGLRWHDRTGEVLFAYSLLLSELSPSKEEIAELVEMCSTAVKESLLSLEQLAREASDWSFCLLALSYIAKSKSDEFVGWIEASRAGAERIVETAQIETLAVLLWALCNLEPRPEASCLRDLREKIVQRLQGQLQDMAEFSIDPGVFEQLISAIQLAKEGFLPQAKEQFAGIEEFTDGRLTLNLGSMGIGMPKVSSLAKAKIGLLKAGFLRPYMLSSNQLDLYQKVLSAEASGQKYVRRYELAAGLLAGGAAVLALALSATGAITFLSGYEVEIAFISLGVYADVAWGIWTEGAVTKHSLSRVVRRLLSLGEDVSREKSDSQNRHRRRP
jgi:hypothetical protein